MEDGNVITSFELMLQGNTAPMAKVTIRPKVQADVSSTDDLAPNGLRPSVTALSVAGRPVDPAESLMVESSASGTPIRIDVTVPDYVAIGLDTTCEEIAEEVSP